MRPVPLQQQAARRGARSGNAGPAPTRPVRCTSIATMDDLKGNLPRRTGHPRMKALCLLSVLTFALSGCTAVLQGFTRGFTSRPTYYPVPVQMAPATRIRRSIMARSAMGDGTINKTVQKIITPHDAVGAECVTLPESARRPHGQTSRRAICRTASDVSGSRVACPPPLRPWSVNDALSLTACRGITPSSVRLPPVTKIER